MHVQGNTELGAESTNVFADMIKTGFGLYDRVVSLKSAESARKRSEDLARAQLAARVAEAEAAKRRAGTLYRPPMPGAPYRPAYRRPFIGAGMDMTTMAMWGGGGLLAIVLITQLMRRK